MIKVNIECDQLREELRSLKTHHQGVTSEQEQLLSQVWCDNDDVIITSLLHRSMK